MDELAAEEIRADVVEQDLRGVMVDGQAAVVEAGEVVGIRRPGPGAHGRRRRPRGAGELVRSDAGLARIADAGEQPQLDAEVDQP